jgi:hypothetical protein
MAPQIPQALLSILCFTLLYTIFFYIYVDVGVKHSETLGTQNSRFVVSAGQPSYAMRR